MIDEYTINRIADSQKTFYRSGATRDLKFRREMLLKLRDGLKKWEPALLEALWNDLHKSAEEAYMTEIGLIYGEIDDALKHLGKWARRRRVCSPLTVMPSKSYIVREPLGNTLIVAPWNYPVQLLLSPLVGAIAAGCTAVLKPSPYVPTVSDTLEKLISDCFSEEYIALVQGNRDVNAILFGTRWDLVFYTGSPATAKVLAAELGVDVLCFTGHKSLFGPQGTGGLCLAEGIDIPALKEGGSGTHSYDRRHPSFYPEHLEAGTINGHGIAGLAAGVAFIEEAGVEAIHAHTLELSDRFEAAVRDVPGVTVYGGHGGIDRTGIVCLNIGSADSGVVSDLLNAEYGICTRAGAHCAPLMHMAMGTEGPGAVRFSFGYFNTAEEVDEGIRAIREIAASLGQE